MTNEEFYTKVGDILGYDLEYKQQPLPRRKSGRWNRNRANGRIPQWGVVRRFSPSHIHVLSKHGVKVFNSEQECFDWLQDHKI